MEVQFRLKEEDVLPNERRISYQELSISRPSHVLQLLGQREIAQLSCVGIHTSNAVASDSSHQAINPVCMLLRLTDNRGVTLLENLVYRDQSLECLDLVGEDGLPVNNETASAISKTTACFHAFRVSRNVHFHASPESRR